MSENEKTKNGWGVLVAAVITVFVLWGLNWFLLWLYGGESDKRGQFGDMFGSVNALFSGLAFAFLIYTIWLQREELTLQREELKLQRKALELQVEELKRQADELAKTADLQAKTLELQMSQIKMTQAQIEEEKNRREIQHKPNFIVTMGGNYNASTAKLNLRLINKGESASRVKIEDCSYLKESGKIYDYIEKNQEVILNWRIEDVPNFPSEAEFQLTFNDVFGKQHVQSLKMVNDKDKTDESDKFKVISK